MPDPNVVAAKGGSNNLLEYDANLRMGMLPIVAQSAHPTIIYRWNIRNITAPAQALVTRNKKTGTEQLRWANAIWVDAWVFALFHMNKETRLFTNAWTTVQENKPRILELKMVYDRTLNDSEQQLILLIQFQLVIDEWLESGISVSPADRSVAVGIATRLLQKELDEKERTDATT